MNSTYTKMKFYPEVKSQTGLNSLRVSCERALIVNEVLRQPFEIVDIILTQEAAIWRSFAEYMFWGATLRFVIFLEEAFILNLNSLITYVFISLLPPIRAAEIAECMRKFMDGNSQNLQSLSSH